VHLQRKDIECDVKSSEEQAPQTHLKIGTCVEATFGKIVNERVDSALRRPSRCIKRREFKSFFIFPMENINESAHPVMQCRCTSSDAIRARNTSRRTVTYCDNAILYRSMLHPKPVSPSQGRGGHASDHSVGDQAKSIESHCPIQTNCFAYKRIRSVSNQHKIRIDSA
jgi:hypothetical protein